jgi:hypothetical protein
MTDDKQEKKKEDELPDEKLEDVAGGIIDIDSRKRIAKSQGGEDEEEEPLQT